MRSPNREDTVAEFHRAFGSSINAKWTPDLFDLRENLLDEEWKELRIEMRFIRNLLSRRLPITKRMKEDLLKEMSDVQYVLSGMAVALGLPLQEAFNTVHQSNMSKLGADGKPIYREDGKVMKGENYKPPSLDKLVEC